MVSSAVLLGYERRTGVIVFLKFQFVAFCIYFYSGIYYLVYFVFCPAVMWAECAFWADVFTPWKFSPAPALLNSHFCI